MYERILFCNDHTLSANSGVTIYAFSSRSKWLALTTGHFPCKHLQGCFREWSLGWNPLQRMHSYTDSTPVFTLPVSSDASLT